MGSLISRKGVELRRVLVVDDHFDTAESLSMMLDLLGHETRFAKTGTEALAIARAFEPELVVLDIGLPDVSGYEVAMALRADERITCPYLVALTGHAQARDIEQSKQAGFDAHVAKPMPLSTLQRIVEQARARLTAAA